MTTVIIENPAPDLSGLRLTESAAAPTPGEGEIRVRIRASSLNFHDYMVAIGVLPSAPGRIPLADASGEVIEVGAGVTEFAPGDQVISCFFPDWQDGPPMIGDFSRTPGDGIDGFARPEVTLPATAFTRAPAGWSHAEAATIPTAAVTAWRSLRDMRAGQTVLALGTGGVSIFALQLAKAAGVRVIHTSSSDDKLARLRDMGADHTINYRSHPDWAAQVLELTGGRGVDHVMEVGGAGTLPQSLASIALGGAIHLVGVLSGISGELPVHQLIARQARIEGLVVGSRKDQQDCVHALEQAGIRPVIDQNFALENLADAFRHQAGGQHFGKIAVTIN